MSTSRLLVVVEDTFMLSERGLVVAPDIDLGEPVQQRFAVELRRPDGTTLRADALAQVPNIIPIRPGVARPRHMLEFATLTKVDVPIGTEIWTAGES